tara:strand:+ start:316 stop:456 length:141 start_codon:yes stop_codon:yes gene_type:complete
MMSPPREIVIRQFSAAMTYYYAAAFTSQAVDGDPKEKVFLPYISIY